jgi:Mg-chelatase subunit ChlD
MRSRAPGDTRPKAVVASAALEAMLDATEGALASRPDFAVKVGLYSFSGSAATILPIQPYDRAVVREALQHLPRPEGDTAIGTAMRKALPDLYQSGLFRKYLLVVTDGENTRGPKPEPVAREIYRRSEGGVQMYFVAFDTNAERFGFLRSVGGDALSAGSGVDLRRTLETIYQGRILAEADASDGHEPAER